MGLLRFLLAVLALPLAVALVPLCADVFRAASLSAGAGLFAAAAGFLAFIVLWMLAPQRFVRVYVFGHELTHALWGLLFGARVSNLRVSLSGGSVTLTRSNVLITLAPYFFPFYTILVVAAALVTRLFVSPLPHGWAWLFAVGFTWSFHLCFTLRALAQRQPDVTEYGRLFSWVFIWLFNVIGVVLWTLATTDLSAVAVWASFRVHSAAAYLAVGRLLVHCWHVLPFNR